MIESNEVGNIRRYKLMAPIIVFLLVACNSSPTVPLPPPEAHVTSPDEYGYVWVSGASEHAVEGDIVLVFNETLEVGSMGTVAVDGSFEIEIEAGPGDTLVVQLVHEGELSQEKIITVPTD